MDVQRAMCSRSRRRPVRPQPLQCRHHAREWKDLLDDDHKPLINKALSGLYPPGSTFKPAVALAALESGAMISPSICTGSVAFGNHIFHCWKKDGHGTWICTAASRTPATFISTQCAGARHRRDRGSRRAAPRTWSGPRHRDSRRKHRPHSGAAPGKRRATASWLTGETLNVGIGQGYVLADAVAALRDGARLANGKGGHAAHPDGRRQARASRAGYESALLRRSISPSCMTAWMRSSTRRRRPLRASLETGFEMAGKTGTAQVRKITRGACRRRHARTHATVETSRSRAVHRFCARSNAALRLRLCRAWRRRFRSCAPQVAKRRHDV